MPGLILADSAQVANATGVNNVVYNNTTTFPVQGTPAVGDVVILEITKSGDGNTVTPSGAAATDWNAVTPIVGTATVQGTINYYWRQFDGTEQATYTWTFPAATRRAVLYCVRGPAGAIASVDPGSGYLGTNTSTNSQQINSSGTLDQAEEFVVTSLVLAASTGSLSPSIDSGFTRVFGANVPHISGFQITAATTALQPTFGWATARAKAAGAIGGWKWSTPAPSTDTGFLVMF